MLEMPARLARGGPMAKANPTATRRVRYEEDLYAWSLEQAALLRARRADSLDWAHLAEEIEWMVGRDRRELKNRVRVILLRLLKWQRQPGRRGGNWRKSLRTQRRHIQDLLQESPSLRRLIPELIRLGNHVGERARTLARVGAGELLGERLERVPRHRLQQVGDRREVIGQVALPHAGLLADARLGDLLRAAFAQQSQGGFEDAGAYVHGLVSLPRPW